MSSRKQVHRHAARTIPRTPRVATVVDGEAGEVPPHAAATETAVGGLYDLVCDDEGQIGHALDFEACLTLAQQHNQDPRHSAHCIPMFPGHP